MSNLEALKELAAKIEAGSADTRDFVVLAGLPKEGCHTGWLRSYWDAYHGSLDAAEALHEAVLPDAEWSVDSTGDAAVTDGTGDWICTFIPRNPARAVLLAGVKRLIAQEEQA